MVWVWYSTRNKITVSIVSYDLFTPLRAKPQYKILELKIPVIDALVRPLQ